MWADRVPFCFWGLLSQTQPKASQKARPDMLVPGLLQRAGKLARKALRMRPPNICPRCKFAASSAGKQKPKGEKAFALRGSPLILGPRFRVTWALTCAKRDSHMGVGQNQWYHFGVGAPYILVYLSGDWDVYCGYRILTHSHIVIFVFATGARPTSVPRERVLFFCFSFFSFCFRRRAEVKLGLFDKKVLEAWQHPPPREQGTPSLSPPGGESGVESSCLEAVNPSRRCASGWVPNGLRLLAQSEHA